jgi:deoxycytidylate deaminase
VTEGCPTGEGYELCGSTHAEVNAAKLAVESANVPGEAFLYGHTWLCGPCQHALTDVGVTTFHVTGESA